MNRPHLWPRIILAALVVMVAAEAALGTGHGASAAKRPDFPDRDEFILECQVRGGVFTDTGDGNIWCSMPGGGGQIVCDSNGKDCYSIPVLSPGAQDPFAGPGNEATTDVGGTVPPASVASRPTSATTLADPDRSSQ